MRTIFKKLAVWASLTAALSLATTSPCGGAVTLLHNCFGAPQAYTTSFDHEFSASENIANHDYDVPNHLVGDGPAIVANCTCPGNMFSSSMVYEKTFAGSPLNSGTNGYGYLTEKIDADITAYADAINSPDGTSLTPLPVNEYPTSRGNMRSTTENALAKTEGDANVCSNGTQPSNAAAIKRNFRWNVVAIMLHVKKPILGQEVIPSTIVAQNYACLYFGTGASCDPGQAEQVSDIWFSGTLSAPLSCTINEGSTIEVEFGSIVSKQFVIKGQPPKRYALKNVDIAYHCDDNAVGNTDRIKLTLTADQGVADSSTPYIAKLLDRDDLGVRVYDENSQNVALDGTYEFPVTMDEQGNGVVKIQAAPVGTTDIPPVPGRFEGNVTVKMNLR
ncbi:fimbrial protein [Enterobacter asburiae]|uniref:fimbrial protein n=1 Tax=Enterobacter asburiae TaxID=61645 RepID=UPI00207565B2|nr:fimbrial protein [Enterobacter asburiae]MCM7565427.1 fimbrial protein [Enterobacter asburiae]MEB5763131.1 fimbrial protein [Enterobacter asburiae]